MKHTTLRNALVTLSSFIFVVGIVTAWTGPSTNPPNGNTDAPINASSSAQVKLGALGVGALDSAGSVRIGTTATACSVLNGGAIRWVDASLGFEYCNKTAWVPFGGGSTGDGNSCFEFDVKVDSDPMMTGGIGWLRFVGTGGFLEKSGSDYYWTGNMYKKGTTFPGTERGILTITRQYTIDYYQTGWVLYAPHWLVKNPTKCDTTDITAAVTSTGDSSLRQYLTSLGYPTTWPLRFSCDASGTYEGLHMTATADTANFRNDWPDATGVWRLDLAGTNIYFRPDGSFYFVQNCYISGGGGCGSGSPNCYGKSISQICANPASHCQF